MEALLEPPRTPRPEWLQNVGLGFLRGIVELTTHGALLAVHEILRLYVGQVSFDTHATTHVIVAFLGYDFLYYWAHRAQHRVGILWACHAVHHQASRFDISVGVRVAAFNPLILFPFFLPLAVLGVPAAVVGPVALVHALAMTWLHTERVPSLGAVEALVNTPALHRVHHSSAKDDSDRNLGGVLVLWDRMFGTWTPAHAVRAFGVAGSASPSGILAAHLEPWRTLARSMRPARTFREKIRLALGQPGTPEPRHRSVHVLAFLISAAVIAVGLDARSVAARWLPILFLLALVTADLASGTIHWFMDRHAARFGRVLARLASEFHEHHTRPGQCLTVGAYRSIFEGAVVVTPVAVVTAACARTDGGATFALLLLSLLVVAPEIHKSAHKPSRRRWLRVLQDLHLVLPCSVHARHHRGDHGAAYCVVTGWWNPLLDSVGFWDRLDRVVCRAHLE